MNYFKRLIEQNSSLRETFFQGIKFSIVGVINTLVSWIAFFTFFYLFKVDFRLSNVISYIFGVTNSFIFNKLWTFKSKEKRISEFFLFILVFFISFSIQYVATMFFKDTLKMHPTLAYISGNIIYTLTGFIGNKFITFRKLSSPK